MSSSVFGNSSGAICWSATSVRSGCSGAGFIFSTWLTVVGVGANVPSSFFFASTLGTSSHMLIPSNNLTGSFIKSNVFWISGTRPSHLALIASRSVNKFFAASEPGILAPSIKSFISCWKSGISGISGIAFFKSFSSCSAASFISCNAPAPRSFKLSSLSWRAFSAASSFFNNGFLPQSNILFP